MATPRNSLLQDQSLLIGRSTDIELLKNKEESKILVLSDSHGASFNFLQVLKREGPECDAMIFCGDGIQDVALVFDTQKKNPDFASFIPPVIGIVEGNNDPDMYPVADCSTDEDKQIQLQLPLVNTIEASGHKIFFTHGHRHALYTGADIIACAAENLGCDIACFGHSHAPFNAYVSSILAVNPGSCWRQRSRDPAGYAVLHLKKGRRFGICLHYGALDGIPFKPEMNY